MHFDLVDRVLELSPERIVTLKQVSMAEEYLQDHFATFPVLPGVMMLEAMVQAGRRLLESRGEGKGVPLVLGRVRALKYGRFVKPGAALRVEVSLHKAEADGFEMKGEGTVIEPGGAGDGGTAVSGRFLLRPARISEPGTK
jgi:3-hydroxyacyl-[acyl-carrier-protein] dehydratase